MSGDDLAVLRRAQEWSAAGRGVALAAVVSTWGSAPRPVGSFLAADDRGAFEGSVSGGCVEGEVVREARLAIADGRPRLLRFGVSDASAFEVGLACGGTVEVHVQRLEDEGVLERLLHRAGSRTAAVLALDLGRGRLRLLDPQAGVGERLAAAAQAAADRDEPARLDGASGAWLLRPFVPPVRVVVCGAVHVAQALVPMIVLAGYEVLVVDPRRAFATEERFPGVRIVPAWPDEGLAGIGLDERTAVVTLTHDPKLDDPALAAALRSRAFYVGALGSRKSQAARRERLRALGVGDADLARIHGPVGLDLGARSPAEIAVSILAEIVVELRGSRPVAIRRPAGPASGSS